ncbi:glycosyltransferase family 4 protein [Candidatus Woesearchaeota archaeon]|nr:glycosyltransferase family 4 protein [Candidatus Woesearchaeota archaeon]
MNILVLTSRYTATRDIIGEDFGRQTRLFSALKKLKHNIDFFVADYRKFENKSTKLHGINVVIKSFGIFEFFSFLANLDRALKRKKYDVLIATSDPLWGIIGYIFSKKHNVKFIYDLHDNYETYDTYKIPFFRYIDNFVMKRADALLAVSYTLKDKISKIRKSDVFVVQNGADTELFKPMSKLQCRKSLNLPLNAKLVVYAGSIQRYEGVDRLVDMFELLKKEFDCLLVVAGRYVKGEEKYINLNKKGIIYLGSLSQNDVVKLINAADVCIVPYTNNNQVTYGFPYKLIEYMACKVPIVATAVGDVGFVLKNHKDSLCSADSIADMKDKVLSKLAGKVKKYSYDKELKELTWDALARRLNKMILPIK